MQQACITYTFYLIIFNYLLVNISLPCFKKLNILRNNFFHIKFFKLLLEIYLWIKYDYWKILTKKYKEIWTFNEKYFYKIFFVFHFFICHFSKGKEATSMYCTFILHINYMLEYCKFWNVKVSLQFFLIENTEWWKIQKKIEKKWKEWRNKTTC